MVNVYHVHVYVPWYHCWYSSTYTCTYSSVLYHMVPLGLEYVPWYTFTVRTRTYGTRVLIMLCHNFLIGKGHTYRYVLHVYVPFFNGTYHWYVPLYVLEYHGTMVRTMVLWYVRTYNAMSQVQVYHGTCTHTYQIGTMVHVCLYFKLFLR